MNVDDAPKGVDLSKQLLAIPSKDYTEAVSIIRLQTKIYAKHY
jgi:hypothetical protein